MLRLKNAKTTWWLFVHGIGTSTPGLVSQRVKIWARYDFDLKTGKSETGLRACVYGVRILCGESNHEVWVEAPTEDDWELVELRPVSEGTNHIFLDAQDLHDA
jgi:hypothetical protein